MYVLTIVQEGENGAKLEGAYCIVLEMSVVTWQSWWVIDAYYNFWYNTKNKHINATKKLTGK